MFFEADIIIGSSYKQKVSSTKFGLIVTKHYIHIGDNRLKPFRAAL